MLSFSTIVNALRSVLDVVGVWALIYFLIKLVRANIKSMQIFKGVLIVLLAKLLTTLFNLTTLNFIVDSVINWGVLAIIIIFQPEIRNALEKMGQTRLSVKELDDDEKEMMLSELVSAITVLSREHTGAIITFERKQSLLDYIRKAVSVDANIKSEVLLTIFYEGTALHDGAVIIQGDRIACASAFYQPTSRTDIPTQYGARHRAAIGISEVTDAVTVVVSEETGNISFAAGGELRQVPLQELRTSLATELRLFNEGD